MSILTILAQKKLIAETEVDAIQNQIDKGIESLEDILTKKGVPSKFVYAAQN